MAVPAPILNQGSGGRADIRVEGSERRLVRRAQQGSAEAFEALFALHWPRAYRTAWLVGHDAAAAEDIAQDAFIAALGALDRFARRRPFGPWLSRIVVNRAIDFARSRRLHAVPTDGLAAMAPAPPQGWSDDVVRAAGGPAASGCRAARPSRPSPRPAAARSSRWRDETTRRARSR